MRLSFTTIGLLACLVVLAAAWSKEDQEIFRLRDEVEADEGQGVSFYDFLGIEPSASQDNINKAYRKQSRALHPDKVKQKFIADKSTGKDKPKKKDGKKGVHVGKPPSQAEIKAAAKDASDRFARLGIVTNILRGPGRERYDHFLANGFPTWKGTGYYYARFRPGLFSVLTGLFIFVGGAGHYLALWLSWKRQREFVDRYIKFARQTALGRGLNALNIPGLDSGSSTPVPGAGNEQNPMEGLNRRQRRMQEKEAKKPKVEKKVKKAKESPAGTPPDTTGPKTRVQARNGKMLVVDSAGNVYLEQADEDGETQEYLLDVDEIHKPTIMDTALYRFPLWAYNKSVGRFLTKPTTQDEEVEEEDMEEEGSSGTPEDYEVLEKAATTAPNGRGKAVRRKKSTRGR